jgi:hypothetical protein
MLPVYVGDRPFQRRVGVVPSGEAAYMEGFPDRQTLFAVLFHKFLEVAAIGTDRPPHRLEEWDQNGFAGCRCRGCRFRRTDKERPILAFG